MCAVPDEVVEGLCYSVFRFQKLFTRCIIYCVVKVKRFSIGSQVVLDSWLMCCVQWGVYIYAVVL